MIALSPERRALAGQLVRYTLTGGLASVVNIAVYWVGRDALRADANLAWTAGYVAAVAVGYVAHSRFSFRGHGRRDNLARTGARFVAVSLVSFALNSLWVWLLVRHLGCRRGRRSRWCWGSRRSWCSRSTGSGCSADERSVTDQVRAVRPLSFTTTDQSRIDRHAAPARSGRGMWREDVAPASTRQTSSRVEASAGQGGAAHARQVHIPALDGLRGFAACAVAVGHIRFHAGLGPVHEQIGSYAVLLFFILSGFLMGHLYLARPCSARNVETYLAARISRIVPLYYAVGLLAFLYGRIDGGFYYAMKPVDGLRHIFMVDNVSVFWTIAPEFQFYFLFPALWWIVRRPARQRLPLAAAAATVVLTLIALRYRLPGLLVISKLHIFLLGVAIAGAGPFVRARIGRGVAAVAQVAAIGILLCLIVPPTAAAADWLYLDGVPDVSRASSTSSRAR